MIFKDLNEQQINAVKAPGHLLLTACPGSGKTRVITRKIAWELQNITHPNKRIIALTFTIRAAEEIERRLRSMYLDTSQLWSGNIHAFCLNWILRPYSSFYPYTQKGFNIIDAVKAEEILDEVKTSFGVDKDNWNKVKFKLYPDGRFYSKDRTYYPVFEAYKNILQSNRYVDFEHLLFYSYDILKRFPKVASTLSSIFQNILIDEYQDTQELQYQIIFQIIRAGQGRTRVCFVGDYDQAIYGSLGGVAKSKEEIEIGIGAEIQELRLSGNYRSSQRVIDFYRNFQSTPSEILAKGKNFENIGFITLNSNVATEQLAEEISRLISINMGIGVPQEEISVLVPRWDMVMPLANKLRELLPDVSFDATGISPMSTNRDNIFYKISRLFLTEPSPKIYSLRYKWATEIGKELAASVFKDHENEEFSAKNILKLCNRIDSNKTDSIEYLKECLSNFLFEINIDIASSPELKISFDSYFSGIEKRVKRKEYALPSDIGSFKKFYKEARGVVISSCHGAKGEEFETVISFGLLRGCLPHWEQIFDPNIDENDISRKLLYVICSRAKNNLHLITEQGRQTQKGKPYLPNDQLLGVIFDYDDV
jgi:superfamily I DNA/RNA helicase